MKLIVNFIFFINVICIYGQNNLIPNSGFELGFVNPRCDNGNFYSSTPIENDIYDWKIATCRSISVGIPWVNTACQYKYSAPDWMDPYFCSFNFGIRSRYVYLEKRSKKGFQDALRTGLLAHMNPNKVYVFKINYTATNRKASIPQTSNPARTTIHFTKYSTHWSASWGNTTYEFPMYPPQTYIAAGNASGWVQHWHIIDAPAINNFFTQFFGIPNLFNNLNNIVLDCSDRQVLIDYVELSPNCDNPLLIENHNFQPAVNEIPYKSGGVLKAGYNVGSPQANGNVVVKSGATATFKAASQIFLEPGFIAEPNSSFKTIIEPCDNSTARTIGDTVQIIDNKTIKIGDITIYDDSREVLPCKTEDENSGEDDDDENDYDVIIYGLDGDTTSFVSYWWDYGNGETSTNPIAKIEFEEPGEYLVKLVLTDSSGVTDTLSKTYVKLDCDNERKKQLNKNNRLANNSAIYPNPSQGEFTLELQNEVGEHIVEIYDIMGKKIWSKTVNKAKTKIDISTQPKGIYLVKVISGNTIFTQKIIYQ